MGILRTTLAPIKKWLRGEQPPDIEAGISLIQQGRYNDACKNLSALAALHPNSTTILCNYGAALILAGNTKEALSSFDKAIVLDRRCWLALVNAASIRIKIGELSQALTDFRNSADPRSMPEDVVLVYAQCLLSNSQFRETRGLLKLHARRLQENATYWLYSGIAHQFLGHPLEAAAALKSFKASAADSTDQDARLGLLVTEQGEYGEARAILNRNLEDGIQSRQGLISYGRLQEILGNRKTAKQAYRAILGSSKNDSEALTNLGNLVKQDGDFSQSEQLYRDGLKHNPGSVVLHKNLSNLLGMTLRNEDAISELKHCVTLAPTNPYHYSDLLFAQQYSNELSLQDHKKASKDWGKRFGQTTDIQPLRARPADHKPIRIGLLSGSFRQHPVGFLGLPGLEALDRSKFSIFCYANQIDSDSFTHRFRALSKRWRPVAHLSDEELAATVREDNIDILIEMSGHAAGHRLPVVARRLAPVQVKWVGGQFNTLGIDSIDYFLSDLIETPKPHDDAFVEYVYRMPNVYACYEPPKNTPDVSPLPALQAKHLTFGSLNKTNKLTRETIALWSKCLLAIPNSRLLLKGEVFGHLPTAEYAKKLFSERGINAERIETRGFTPHPDLLSTYDDIDIALDPVPYSGCLTTCEALWMGVPVLTMSGTTFAGRHSASFLTAVSLGDWVVENEEAYIDVLRARSSNLGSLSELRQSLRQRVRNSPLCDTTRFGADLGSALREMWRERMASLSEEAA